ncbi:hypothetical protein DES34_103440 [Brevibacillus brevis]|nr:hypothetical protein C7J99_13740 [Brevibacillus brevis]RED33123.1 hypothetical protein DES34_103440 [Brevibacillus brevis]VEF90793.1 Uncharacterised protein [Brevibacillus brevis]
MNKLLSALLTAIFYCVFLASIEYTPMNIREENTYYFSYFSLLFIYLMYSVPFLVIVGIPFSMLIEKIENRITFKSSIRRYSFNVSLYLLAGIIVALFFSLLSKGNILMKLLDFEGFLIYIIPSLLYYHLLLLNKMWIGNFRH